MIARIAVAVGLASVMAAGRVHGQVTGDAPGGLPVAIVDLARPDGLALVRGTWRYADAQIVEVDHRAPGPDLRASGAPVRTHDLTPHAGAADFDDSSWEVIAPGELDRRRTNGRLAFGWYRLNLTIPDRLGDWDPTGATIVFEIVVDDYAEVWVDGQLPLALGRIGGDVIRGFNAPNRVVLTRNAQPGQRITIAVLGINGPISNPPGNFVWIRSATLDFLPSDRASVVKHVGGTVERLDAALDAVVPAGTVIEQLADGFQFTEGPVWSPDGYLLFSDPNANTIYRGTPDGEISVFRTKSGYTGVDIGRYHQPGSNGLTFDPQGRLVINEHGNRRVTRLEKTGAITILADRYQGKRLNSPNDLVYASNGRLYFTDPPFGLPRVYDDPAKELTYSGVFMLAGDTLRLLTAELKGPNGIALSPDEQYLYVGNWDLARKVVMRYEIQPDGSLAKGQVFLDLTREPGEEAIDGVKVDQRGNVYVSGPGGVWIVAPTGRRLGIIKAPELPANFAWGDADGRSLYLTARHGLYRIRLSVPGIRPSQLAERM